jgi:hypothetical protein
MLCAIAINRRIKVKHKSIIFIILLGVLLAACTQDESSKSWIQVLFYSPPGSALSIDMLELNIIESRIIGEHRSTISPADFDFNDYSDFYYTELSTSICCHAAVEFLFSEAGNEVVSGSFAIPLEPEVQWSIYIHDSRPPFFYLCYDNHVYPVAEEYRAAYGDSLFVKWVKAEIE